MKSKLWIVVLVFGAIGGVWFADVKSQEKMRNEGRCCYAPCLTRVTRNSLAYFRFV